MVFGTIRLNVDVHNKILFQKVVAFLRYRIKYNHAGRIIPDSTVIHNLRSVPQNVLRFKFLFGYTHTQVTDLSVDTRHEVESYWKEQLELYTANQTINQEVQLVFFSLLNTYVLP